VYLGDVTTAILQAEESQYTTIKSMDELYANLDENSIPRDVISMDATDYSRFLDERRKLMAAKIRDYFNSL
jgi:hypothetical protein